MSIKSRIGKEKTTDINGGGGYVKGTQRPTPRVTSGEAVLGNNSKLNREKHCITF